MNKKLVVKIEDQDVNKVNYMNPFDPEPQIPNLQIFDCPNVIRHVTQKLGHSATFDDAVDAIDVLAAYLSENDTYYFKVNITERNNSLRPPKEMSIEDIEKELGYKIKIVSDKE